MQGIPVLSNGDPVALTFVLAGSYDQFANWCRYSQVNPRSRLVRYVSDDRTLRGCHGVVLVYTGTWHARRDLRMISHEIRYLESVGAITRTYSQFESCEIEPNVVD